MTTWAQWNPGERVAVFELAATVIPLERGDVEVPATFLGRAGVGHVLVSGPAVDVTITADPEQLSATVGESATAPALVIDYAPAASMFGSHLSLRAQGWTSALPDIASSDGPVVRCKAVGTTSVSKAMADHTVSATVTCRSP